MDNLCIGTARQVSFDNRKTNLQSDNVHDALSELAEVRPSNPNLLDNWYFVGGGSQQGGGQFPINQRGETKYTEVGYTIDRWHANTATEVSITDSGLYFPVRKGLYQYFEKKPSDGLVTISLLTADGLLATASFILQESNTDISGGNGFIFRVGHNNERGYFVGFYKNEEPFPFTCLAAKLELGDQQTLAHKEGDDWVLNDPPPNFQQELAKCQRYQIQVSNNTLFAGVTNKTNMLFTIPLPVTLYKTPANFTANARVYTPDLSKTSGLSITSINIIKLQNGITVTATLSDETVFSGYKPLTVGIISPTILDSNL